MQRRTVCFHAFCCCCSARSSVVDILLSSRLFSVFYRETRLSKRKRRRNARFLLVDRRKTMLYQETYRLWQIHQRSNRSIRSLVARSSYKVTAVPLPRLSHAGFARCSVEQTAAAGVARARHSTPCTSPNHRRSIAAARTRDVPLQRSGVDSHLRPSVRHARARQVQGSFAADARPLDRLSAQGMLKRNQSSIDTAVADLLREHSLSSPPELLTTSPSKPSSSPDIPRYVRVNLLKTTAKRLRLNLKELAFKKMKDV